MVKKIKNSLKDNYKWLLAILLIFLILKLGVSLGTIVLSGYIEGEIDNNLVDLERKHNLKIDTKNFELDYTFPFGITLNYEEVNILDNSTNTRFVFENPKADLDANTFVNNNPDKVLPEDFNLRFENIVAIDNSNSQKISTIPNINFNLDDNQSFKINTDNILFFVNDEEIETSDINLTGYYSESEEYFDFDIYNTESEILDLDSNFKVDTAISYENKLLFENLKSNIDINQFVLEESEFLSLNLENIFLNSELTFDNDEQNNLLARSVIDFNLEDMTVDIAEDFYQQEELETPQTSQYNLLEFIKDFAVDNIALDLVQDKKEVSINNLAFDSTIVDMVLDGDLTFNYDSGEEFEVETWDLQFKIKDIDEKIEPLLIFVGMQLDTHIPIGEEITIQNR